MAEQRPDRGSERGPGRHPLAAALVALLLGGAAVLGWIRRSREGPRRVSEEALDAGHETSDMRLHVVFGFLALLVVVAGVVSVAAAMLDISHLGTTPSFIPQSGALDNLATPAVVTTPVLEEARGEEIGPLRQQEDALLQSYGWVDRSAGTVRIPIDRAKELLLARGLPARPASAAQSFHDDASSAPSVESSGRVMEPADRW